MLSLIFNVSVLQCNLLFPQLEIYRGHTQENQGPKCTAWWVC